MSALTDRERAAFQALIAAARKTYDGTKWDAFPGWISEAGVDLSCIQRTQLGEALEQAYACRPEPASLAEIPAWLTDTFQDRPNAWWVRLGGDGPDAVVCDGHSLLVLEGIGATSPAHCSRWTAEAAPGVVAKLLPSPDDTSRTRAAVSGERFAAWLDGALALPQPDDSDELTACIGPACVDVRRLRRWAGIAAQITGGDVDVSYLGPEDVVELRGRGWRMVIMPVRAGDDGRADGPDLLGEP